MKKKNLLKSASCAIALSMFIIGCSAPSKTQDGGGQQSSGAPVQAFNPDEVKDGIDFTMMRSQFGAVPKPNGEVKLGGVSKAFENEYWRTLKEGMEIGAKKMQDKGFKVSIDVKAAQGEGDEQGQLSIVKDMVNKKYAALLLSPISDGNLVPGVEDAKKANIPVINVNDGLIETAPNYVGPKAIQNGELAAEWIANKINKEGNVAVIIGMPKAFAARQRTAGFENWMKQNAPNVKIAEKQNADWDRAKAKDLASTWIKKHPDLKAIFANNDTMALGAVEAVKASGKKILVVGVDGIGEAYESIKKGELSATIDSFPKYKGQIAVEAATRIIGGQKLPRVIWTPQALIDSSNVNTPAEQIIKWQEPEFK
ncbi:substrate-binding domain-containing protein [Paenibacillus alginolyticus]|uniref:Substrate-binding domain-containing protein n=1 Tax=Paenibacillus alginolyticus TaxID=59839 RepID=A0ABT4GI96_9BACL|nr:substrate-binding domain-containing protein [Paenibacillus alginolyticus]MCY9669532.1 substrate-binding domain-containing protein [Paenibacillus alginolyticus]MCY9695906.1 substrate-binding domain-containing protein [Paenibacillus alginolyticus]MEC0146757.1 substrate-binding domain-containing protein [Paenibacillus alginolyticus]